MNGFEKSVGWSEEHSFRANHLKRKRKETKKQRKRNKCFHKKKNINRKISEVEVVIHFRVEAIMHFLSVFNTRSFFFFRFEDRETTYPIQ